MSPYFFRRLACLLIFFASLPLAAQQPAPPLPDVVQQLQRQVAELQAAVAEMRAESAQFRAEALELRRALQAALAQSSSRQLAAAPTAPPTQETPAQEPANVSARLARLQEEFDLLSSKVDDHYQTKVESASKYRVRFSGLVLLNLFSDRGSVDNQDAPQLVRLSGPGATGGSFGGTLRQSQLRFELFGPDWAGARTHADLALDFAGGFPNAPDGVTMGLARLRTATFHLDWPNFSVVAGQDAPLFSPLSPTSLASLVEPAFSYSGNLWTWVPQLRVERRFTLPNSSRLIAQFGILDPLTGERPLYQFDRAPQAGELSRQPGYAGRIAFTRGEADNALTIGVGGYYSRQRWTTNVDSWAATADWSIPLVRRLALTGEFYRGRALGGFGGGLGQSALLSQPPGYATAEAEGLDSMGGWTQLKFRATSTLEFNAAVGQDNPFAYELRSAAYFTNSYYSNAARNRSALVNFIYRPRSDLLFSVEYRHLHTYEVQSLNGSAEHINVMMGVLF